MESDEQCKKTVSKDEPRELSSIEVDGPQKIPYPKRVLFIIGNEFCERFNYFGMKAILVFFLKYKLDYTENDATLLYHGFIMAIYSTCLIGAIVSDVWLGKFKTILYLSIIYAIGSVFIAMSSIPLNIFNFSPQRLLIGGIVFIAFGSGGIKPCVVAFGGDQFHLPDQTAQLRSYFSWFYFSINVGALLSTTITPILREDVQCFGDDDCYPLAFGLPAILMLIAILCFLCGSTSYTQIKTSSQNILVQVTKCVANAISTKIREGRLIPRKSLLDYSIDKYGEELVNDTKALFNILVLFLPLSVFWALFDQQASRWTFQATRMNGNIGFYTIKPDQMQVLNPIMMLTFILLSETMIYPIIHKIGIRRPLQKMVTGGMLAAFSFFLAALVQWQIELLPVATVHMLWQIPQYVALTMGEVMFNITLTRFAYEQAPQKMKSLVQSFYLMTEAIGNVILLCIAGSSIVDEQSKEFLLFSGIMFVDMLVFMAFGYKFKSRTQYVSSFIEKDNQID